MNTETISTTTNLLKKTDFEGMSFYQNVVDPIQTFCHATRLNYCDFIANLPTIVKRKPDLNILEVKHAALENKEDIWLPNRIYGFRYFLETLRNGQKSSRNKTFSHIVENGLNKKYANK